MPDNPVTVRRARPAAAADCARMTGDPDVYANLMQLPPPSEDRWRARLEEGARPNAGDLVLIAELGGHAFGSAGLHPAPQLRRRHAAVIGISVVPEAQRRGVGRALMQAMRDCTDQRAQILRIELTVFTDTERAIALYRHFGFRVEGPHRGYAMRHGVDADVHCMARLHPSPSLPAWPADA